MNKKLLFAAARTGDTASVLENLNEVISPAFLKLAASTALILAAWKGHADTVRALYEWGVDINYQDTEGNTALMYAARWGHKEVVEQLLHCGAMKNLENKNHYTAYDHARDENTRLLLTVNVK